MDATIRSWQWRAAIVIAAWGLAVAVAVARPADDSASALRLRFAGLQEQLERGELPPRLHVESTETKEALQGDVYALADYPIGIATAAFVDPASWCEALLLHPNVKFCQPGARGDQRFLTVYIGRKYEQPLERAHRVEFTFRVVESGPDHVSVDLLAARGPLGTRDYRISLAAVGVPGDRSFLQLRYSCLNSAFARFATAAYFGTTGSGKVGFSTVGAPDDPEAKLVGGVRGAIERNAVRYYLGIDAHLAEFAAPAPERFERSMERWFRATELWPRQLRELDHDTYAAMKRNEYRRQRNPAAEPPATRR